MFSFWKKKPEEKVKKTGVKTAKNPEGLTREEIIAQANANAAAAREEIGDETLQKIVEALTKKENSPLEQAKRKVEAMDKEIVRDEIRLLMREDKE